MPVLKTSWSDWIRVPMTPSTVWVTRHPVRGKYPTDTDRCTAIVSGGLLNITNNVLNTCCESCFLVTVPSAKWIKRSPSEAKTWAQSLSFSFSFHVNSSFWDMQLLACWGFDVGIDSTLRGAKISCWTLWQYIFVLQFGIWTEVKRTDTIHKSISSPACGQAKR